MNGPTKNPFKRWWQQEFSRTVNVLPVNDLREHEENADCWCRPKVEDEDGGTVIVHNSMDGRELIERGERKAS